MTELRPSRMLYLLLFVLLELAAIFMIPSYGSTDVDQFWLRWINDAEQYGLVRGYEISTLDYPPLSVALLWMFSRAAALIGVSTHAGLKLGLFLFLNITVGLFGLLQRDLRATVLLMAGLIVNSVCLAYVDVLFMPPLLASFWCFSRRRMSLGLFLFTLSCLIKYQPLIIAPFIILHMWRQKRLTPISIALSSLPVLMCAIIYGPTFFVTLARALNHLYLSAYAFNINWALTRIVEIAGLQGQFTMRYGIVFLSQAISLMTKLLFMSFYFYLLAVSREKRFSACLLRSSVAYISYFVLCTGVHENHMMLAVLSMAFVAAGDKCRLFDASMVALYSTLNMVYVYGVDGSGGLLDVEWARGLDVLISILFFVWFVRLICPFLSRNGWRFHDAAVTAT